jgi:outer membrane protein OmpA-like peptidoglycan-associated protein/tetratricopeptide (TPR) repeat protein
MKKILIITIAALICAIAPAQTKRADKLFANWEYFKAAQLYEKAIVKNPTQDLYYKLGQSYLKMHRYKQALAAYDKVYVMGHYTNASFYLDYGLALKTSERYADAKIAFTTYSEMNPSDPRGKFYLSSCDTVITDRKSDMPITITSVSSLNSSASDMCPMLYKDGIVFISSRKADGDGSKIYSWDGEYYLHVFYTKKGKTDTSFPTIAPIQSNLINKKYLTGPVCFSRNYDTIFFNSVSKELKGKEKKTLNIERNKIYSAIYKKGEWTELKPFQYNSDTFSIATPYLTQNGSRIYFASDMPGGYGGADIYYCDRTVNGWSKPVNMGPNINTFGNEKFPTMDSAGSFYFSSDGYMGFGGMDICVSKNINGTFGKASVLKAPFNSAGDDYGITFIKSGRIGYFSSNRSGGKGDEDIYYFNMDKDSLPCPVVASSYVIGYKCPPKPQPIAVVDTVSKEVFAPVKLKNILSTRKGIMRIHFDLDKANIRPDVLKTLDSIVVVMKKNIELTIVINGYCDWRGTAQYNQALSEQRSASVVAYLASKGIDKKRMQPNGYGKTKFTNMCSEGVECTDYEQQQNRRVEMWFPAPKTIATTSAVNK